ncbi:hypothetical protein PR202_ga24944 [Eleusine coracana subsp. coracana]|uniref:RING-type E3 ubiquitin transferase n=1 Tax=Eleusine coracana subsp. coracana TaxID=191504 RepID=A0AAV5D9D2_ELECO|nr:hypothetical protein PR202_ga24944 [Eleusine coracana subsp. coracana]
MNSSSHVLDAEPDVQCLVCTRPFTLDTEVNDSFEALAICSECKRTVLNENNRDEIASNHHERRRRRRPMSNATRFEPFEAAFSQRLSHLINLATQDHEVDISTPPVSRQQAPFTSTPNRSRRWHASDDESDGLSYVDSVFGETGSNLSFGDDGGESDASLDQRARMGREIVIQLDSESYLNTDTDIDPMNAGMDLWDSDDQEDEESEESDFDEVVEAMQQRRHRWNSIAPSGSDEHDSEDDAWTSGTAIPRTVGVINLRADIEGPAIRRHFIGNPGDYVDARQFEMLLDQFAEDNNTGRGAPPAAKSIVENLPSVVISTNHKTNDDVTCPVCKDNMPVKAVAKQLPCAHLYHSSCILPWLSYRNTCPVCRYELPTDDLEYERLKQATTNDRRIHGVEHIHLQEPVEEISDEPEVEGAFNTRSGATEGANMNEHSVRASQHPNRARGRHRWLVIAAAPVVSLLCLGTESTRKKLRRQGVKGPVPTLLCGNTTEMKRIQQGLKPVQTQNSNDYISTLLPHFVLWRKIYGALEILHVSDPDMVKDIGHCTPSELGKPSFLKKSRKALFGGGIFVVNGDEWAFQRKIIAPEFFMEKIKGMIQSIEDATILVLEAWDSMLDNAGGSREIVVDDYLRNLSADVISRACFGSSFKKGEEIFCKLRQLQKAISQQDAFVGLPALWKYLPSRTNREIKTLDEEIWLLILDVIKEHGNSTTNDFLHAIINGAHHRSISEDKEFIITSCKTIYFAGHETTSVTVIWCLMLLATHPEWQERARAEAHEVCHGRATLDVDILRRLKILTMVIQETLRLYAPASLMMREALTDIKIGGLDVPRGTIVQVARLMLHLDKDAWGPDAGEFRPDRFANGVAAACKPAHMYMPFGLGPRNCIGQNLAMNELKVVLARLLSRFSFLPSPSYRYAPTFRLTIEPGFGMPLVVTRL